MSLRQRPLIALAALSFSALAACSGPDQKPDAKLQEPLNLDGPTAEQLKQTPCANPRWMAAPAGMPDPNKAAKP